MSDVASLDYTTLEVFDEPAVQALGAANLFSLHGRTALLTGGAGGIGRWLAAGLGMAGARVLLTDVTDGAFDDVLPVLRSSGIEVETITADLMDSRTPDLLVECARERFGRLDILINCAAVNRRMPVLHVDRESFDFIMGVDFKAPYFLAQAAARLMSASGGGTIVNIGSINVSIGLQDVSLYGAAKAALAQLTKVMAVEWTHLGIRANCLCPGMMMTPLSRPIWQDQARVEWMTSRIPMQRPGRPSELVGMCLLLASDAGSYITGQTFFLDGGMLAGSRWAADASDPSVATTHGR